MKTTTHHFRCGPDTLSGHAKSDKDLEQTTSDRAEEPAGSHPPSNGRLTPPHLLPSSLRRRANMRMLVIELAQREMKADQLAGFLNSSAACARRYILELRDAGIIEAVHNNAGVAKSCHPSYRLRIGLEHACASLEALVTETRGPCVVISRASESARLMHSAGEPRRNLHIMADDVNISICIERTLVRRDPLVAALFGSGSSACIG